MSRLPDSYRGIAWLKIGRGAPMGAAVDWRPPHPALARGRGARPSGLSPVRSEFKNQEPVGEESRREAVASLLAQIRAGDTDATGRLLDLAYNELRGIAGGMLSEQRAGHTLQPTAVVNEVCARMLKSGTAGWNDEQHFYRAAAKAMRHLLVDHARARRAQKRGGGDGVRVSLELVEARACELDLVSLDDILTKLAATDARLAEIFELRFFVGLTVEQTAAVIGISARTVELDTRLIRAWVSKELVEERAE